MNLKTIGVNICIASNCHLTTFKSVLYYIVLIAITSMLDAKKRVALDPSR